MSKNTAKIARDAFAEGAISLLRRALAEGLGAHILVDAHGVMTHADLHDADGAEILSLKLHATQLALPLAGPVERAPSHPPPAAPAVVPAAPAAEVPTARVWIAEAEWDALDGGMQNYLCGVSLRGDACGTAPVPIDWQGAVGFVVARAPIGEVLDELIATLRDAGIEHHVGDEPPVAAPVEEPPPVEAPKPAAKKKPRAKKASAVVAKGEPTAQAVAGVWQLIERLRDGSTEHNEWEREDSARAFFARSRKHPGVVYARLADPTGAMVDEYTAPAGPRPGRWRIVEHPIGASPVEIHHEEPEARYHYAATVQHGGDGLRRVELFDDTGLLVDSHNYGVPAQPARGLDGVPASVPAHLRDLAALTSPDWWCVVAQPAVRPDLTEVKLCIDESTAVATAESLRAADVGSNSLTRVVVFDDAGAVHTAWHRHEPAVCDVVEAHQSVELFRVTVSAAGVYAGTPPAEWGAHEAPCRFAESTMRNSPAEVAEGPFALHWHPDVAALEVYAIVPRALVAVVVRRCTTWGGARRTPRVTPELDAPSTALRTGSSVVVGGETWSVLLVDHERAVLTRGEEVAEVALGDVRPSGTDAGWWADRVRMPKSEAVKKAPKRAKAVV